MLGVEWYVIFIGAGIAILAAIVLYLLGWLMWVIGVFLVSAAAAVIDVVWGDWIWKQVKEADDEEG